MKYRLIDLKTENTVFEIEKEKNKNFLVQSTVFLNSKEIKLNVLNKDNNENNVFLLSIGKSNINGSQNFSISTELGNLDFAFVRGSALEGNFNQKHSVSQVKSQMPGKILKILVSEGQDVEVGQTILVIEAMKMENEVKVSHNGKIEKISVKEGQKVEAGELLFIVV
jgi:biotin carboxyl carrier protein